jgi:hypothetical protein
MLFNEVDAGHHLPSTGFLRGFVVFGFRPAALRAIHDRRLSASEQDRSLKEDSLARWRIVRAEA